MKAYVMTENQKARSSELYEQARRAMSLLANEPLNLSEDTTQALNYSRSWLETMDCFRAGQPTEGILL